MALPRAFRTTVLEETRKRFPPYGEPSKGMVAVLGPGIKEQQAGRQREGWRHEMEGDTQLC